MASHLGSYHHESNARKVRRLYNNKILLDLLAAQPMHLLYLNDLKQN